MKVLFLSRLFVPHVGGVERHVYKLSKELIKLGHRVQVISEQYDERLKLEEYIEGIKVTRIPYSRLTSKAELWQWMLRRKESFSRADLVHVHDVFWWYLPIRTILSNKSVYTTFHGYEPGEIPGIKNKIHRKVVESLSNKTVCVGGFMKKWYGTNPDMTIYGAAEAKPVRPIKKKSAVFVGRLEADTGIFAYLRAMLEIKGSLSLDIYGKGPEEEEIKRIVKRNRLPVALHGWTNDPLKIIKGARYIFTSQYLTILEAMQSKRLVISVYTDEMKKDYLYMHPMSRYMIIAKDGKDLAEKYKSLSELYENEYVDCAYVWAREQTWSKLTKKYFKLWGI